MAYLRPSSLAEARWRSGHFPLEDYEFASIFDVCQGSRG